MAFHSLGVSQLTRAPDTPHQQLQQQQLTHAHTEPLNMRAATPTRILCLHGGGANSNVMRYQTRALREAFGGGAVFEYIDGGRAWPEDQVPDLLRRLFKGPYHGWYGVDDDCDDSTRGKSWHTR